MMPNMTTVMKIHMPRMTTTASIIVKGINDENSATTQLLRSDIHTASGATTALTVSNFGPSLGEFFAKYATHCLHVI